MHTHQPWAQYQLWLVSWVFHVIFSSFVHFISLYTVGGLGAFRKPLPYNMYLFNLRIANHTLIIKIFILYIQLVAYTFSYIQSTEVCYSLSLTHSPIYSLLRFATAHHLHILLYSLLRFATAHHLHILLYIVYRGLLQPITYTFSYIVYRGLLQPITYTFSYIVY